MKGLKAELKCIYYYNWGTVHSHIGMLLNYTSTTCNTQPQLSRTCNISAATSRKFVKVFKNMQSLITYMYLEHSPTITRIPYFILE